MLDRPAGPEPLIAFMKKVSARSLEVCAVRMRAAERGVPLSAESSRTYLRAAAYRTSRAAPSRLRPSRSAKLACSTHKGTPRRAQRSRTNASSPSDAAPRR